MSGPKRTVSALRTADPIKDKWWTTLVIPYVVGTVQLLALGTLDPSDYPSAGSYVAVSRALTVLFFVTFGLSIVGLYFDILYVAEVSDWRPTMWYALMFFTPAVGIAIGLHYLYKRSEYVGLSLATPPQAHG